MADAKFKELFDFFHNPGEKTVNVHAAVPRDGKTVWIFGRGADCDFVYSTPKVSRVHCKIEYIDSHYYLTDLNSTNGTYLNGRRIERKERLFTGDIIGIGNEDIVFTSQMFR